MKQFPKGFYWGAATASYQVEGGNEETDWAEAAREGKVPSAGKLADHYHLYEKDFDLAKELGHNAHRFSIEWARIEPEEGVFDEEEIEHYRKVLRALRARNIEPFITLWHFSLPLWFADKGGFERQDAPEIFARYCGKVVSELGDLCTHYSTINEPIVFAGLGWLKGNWPPFKQFTFVGWKEYTNSGDRTLSKPKKSLFAYFTYRKVVKNLAAAHNAAYTAIKKSRPAADVSLVKHVVAFDADWKPHNQLRAWMEDRFLNHSFLKKVYKHCDSIGLNFYHYVKFGSRPEFEHSDMGWEMAPSGIYHALKTLSRYGKPIFVSEAGVADDDDSHRAWYIREQVKGVARALEEGIDVRGHMYWSLLDNYEWALGIEKRFGLIEVNYDTLLRKVRPSAQVYKKICTNNAVLTD